MKFVKDFGRRSVEDWLKILRSWANKNVRFARVIYIHRIWEKSSNPDLNPNPDLDLPTIAPSQSGMSDRQAQNITSDSI